MSRTKWYKLLSREGVDLLTVSVIDVAFYDALWDIIKTKKEILFSTLDKKVFTHYIGIKPEELGKYCFENYFNSVEKIKKLYYRGGELLEEDKKIIRIWKKKIKEGNGDRALLNAFLDFKKSFFEINYFYTVWPWPAVEYFQDRFEGIISTLIESRDLNEKYDLIIASAYKPWKDTAIIKLQKEVLQNKDTAELANKYQFLRSWSAVWYSNIDKAWVESMATKKSGKQKIYTTKKLIEILKPNREQKNFFNLAPYLVFYKDYRDDVRRKYVYMWAFFFDAIAEKFGIERDDVGYLSIEELEKVLRTNKIDRQKIIKRKKSFCVVTVDGKNLRMKIIDSSVLRYKKIAIEIEKAKASSAITGLIAQKGIVRGKVRILRTFHDIKKVLPGDIIVANTTHPNYLPAMQRAAGFITNEGGIVSHAAIVARELKKPCIVGTKNATKILKDGDLVEVDADNGIVKILKQ